MASTRARAAVPPLVDEAARASFRTNGYLTVPGVLSPAELHELRAVADAWLDESRNTLTPTASFDLEPTHTAAAPQLRRVKNPSSSEYPLRFHRLSTVYVLTDRSGHQIQRSPRCTRTPRSSILPGHWWATTFAVAVAS